MFDVNDPVDLAALKSEQANDPVSMGYAAVDGQTQKTLGLFNDADSNVGGETTNLELTTAVLLTAMVPADLGAQQVDDGERRYIESFLNRDFETVIEPWRAQIRDAFRTNSDTVIAIDALFRDISRAEVLFGSGTVISKSDWIAARDS
jgi:hypothetical protein